MPRQSKISNSQGSMGCGRFFDDHFQKGIHGTFILLLTIFHLICVLQIMSGTWLDNFINALLATKIQQSVDIS